MLKKFLESGSQKTRAVVESMFRCSVKRQLTRFEIADTCEVSELASFGFDYLVAVTSMLDGDMKGKALLLMRARDFQTVCELLTQSAPYMINRDSGSDAETLAQRMPDWVRSNAPKSGDGKKMRAMMFDAMTEFANIIFAGYLTATYDCFGLTTFHTIPEIKLNLQYMTIAHHLSDSSVTKQHILFAENHFVVLPYEFKMWFFLSPGGTKFTEALNRI